MMKDMTMANCHTYYTQACIYHNVIVGSAAKDMCRLSLITYQGLRSDDLIANFSKVITCFSIDDWLRIFTSLKNQHVLSIKVSMLVSKICEREDVDWIAFEKLTSIRFMPQIACMAAIPLLKLESSFNKTKEASGNFADPSDDPISNLQRRCAYALVEAVQKGVPST
jgi:hypothetical protein